MILRALVGSSSELIGQQVAFSMAAGFNKGMRDYYKILEIDPEASPEVMTKAYKTLVYHHHPDRYHVSDKSQLVEKMKLINEAYETLSDPRLRQTYDARYKPWKAQQAEFSHQQQRQQAFKNIGYWFLLTLFLAFSGRAAWALFTAAPVLIKLIIVAVIAWIVRQFMLGRKA